MPVQIQITFATDSGGKVVRVGDLPLEVLEAIAVADPDPEVKYYWQISSAPFRDSRRTYAVLDALADHLGIAHVERNLSETALDRMTKILPAVEDQPAQDGYPQVPGETEGGSSSISPGLPTAGLSQ